MPHCAAFGCNFQSKGNKVTDVSLHSFPNDEKRRKEWEDACGRVQLPKDPRLCSRHFSPDAFDAFNRSKLLKQLTGAGYKRRLKPDAIPTIFAQDVTKRSFKANNKRAKKQQREQKVDSQPQSGQQQQQQQQPPTPSPPTPTVVVTKVEPPDIKPIKEEIEETPVEIVKDSVNPPCSPPTTDEVNPPCSPPTTDAAETAAQRRPHVDPPVHLAVPCLTDHTYADMPSLKLISATDTQYSAAVLKSMNEQRNHGLFCDVTIIIQDKKFRAHKTILSASSTYFHQLFSVAGQVIELNFIKAEIFEEILNYIYSSKIVRVRSDMLEELISAGQILGVKFIANLASPLSQVKGLPGLSKEPENRSDTSTEMMPIITESFSISAEEFNQTSKPTGNDEDEDCDVMFVSQTSAQSKAASQKVSSAEVIDLDASDTKDVASKKNEESHTKVEPQEENATTTTQTPPVKTPILTFPAPTLPDSSPLRSPDSSSNNPSSPARVSSGSAPTTPARSTSFTPEPPTVYTASQSPENSDIMGVHKKHVATSTQQGDFKLRLLDVSESPTNQVDIPKSAIVAKKTVTLNTATEIDSISSGCKVYANIGENTYDIVPVKEDPGEGGSKANKGKRSLMATPLRPFDKTPVSPKAGPNKKKTKTELEDHYELIMDGKTFYVCIVCKRPYVCLTSLRRHFNTHSWEKKYPCRYCNKVFALAEYRTKHEIHHTGERRYQCLLCNEMFMNYQLLSTHCKQVHNQDPSGRKEKDDGNNNLYRLLPCKTVQMKPNSWAADGQGVPVISEDGSVHHITPIGEDIHSSTQSRMLSWDDIFVEPDAHMTPAAPLPPPPPQPGSNINTPAQSSTEFDFVIPETY